MLKIGFLGDSITAGAGASAPGKTYAAVLCEKIGAKEINYGVGGTRIARQKRASEDSLYDEYFLQRAKKINEDLDFLFVFGGTNDYGHGDAKTGEESDDTPYTFHGALNMLIKRLTELYGKDKICFILPLRRFEEEDLYGQGNRKEPTLNLKGYVDIIRAKCEKAGIDYIDLYKNGIPKPVTDKGDEYTADGLHPNDKGHLFIAEKIKNYLGL